MYSPLFQNDSPWTKTLRKMGKNEFREQYEIPNTNEYSFAGSLWMLVCTFRVVSAPTGWPCLYRQHSCDLVWLKLGEK